MEKLTQVLDTQSQSSLGMGGFASYVWPSFIIAFVVMTCMVVLSVRSLRKAQRTLAELQHTNTQSLQNEA
jgi:heme exporter protein CcmD